MYRKILVPVENSLYDDAIVDHVVELAKVCKAQVLLIHVADGWAARNMSQLNLRESEEIRKDRAYLESVAERFCDEGFDAESVLATGDPPTEIAAAAEREGCDLIAMSTHGHRFLNDLVRGSVANDVRHRSTIPVLLVRGQATGEMRAVGAPRPTA